MQSASSFHPSLSDSSKSVVDRLRLDVFPPTPATFHHLSTLRQTAENENKKKPRFVDGRATKHGSRYTKQEGSLAPTLLVYVRSRRVFTPFSFPMTDDVSFYEVDYIEGLQLSPYTGPVQ